MEIGSPEYETAYWVLVYSVIAFMCGWLTLTFATLVSSDAHARRRACLYGGCAIMVAAGATPIASLGWNGFGRALETSAQSSPTGWVTGAFLFVGLISPALGGICRREIVQEARRRSLIASVLDSADDPHGLSIQVGRLVDELKRQHRGETPQLDAFWRGLVERHPDQPRRVAQTLKLIVDEVADQTQLGG